MDYELPARRRASFAAALLAFAASLHAATLSGTVTDAAGAPLPGAIVTLTDARGVGVSVYADAAGRFSAHTTLAGAVELRARKRYYRDEMRQVELGGSTRQTLQIKLAPLEDARALGEDHPSLSHFSRIAFDRDDKALFSRGNFARDCASCHALGDATTRKPRSAEAWLPIVQRMHGYLGNGDPKAAADRAALLAAAFDGTPPTSRPRIPFDPMTAGATVYHWRLDGALVPHDPAVHSKDNRIYTVDMMGGQVLETDLDSGRTVAHVEPADGMPPGGVFTLMGMPAPYDMKVPRAPHSLAEGKDGHFYLTDLVGNSIGEFDPVRKTFKHHAIPGKALYPHTIRADRDGIMWFTIAFSNQVGRFDPATGAIRVIQLPDSPSLSIVGGPSPYGIDIHPKDGSVWYAKLAADKIGRIDARSFEIREYDSPVRGPRRQRFDAAGRLWVAGFSEGAIARIDVDHWRSTIYRLPNYAPGEVPAPYALAVHPRTQEIWVNDTMLDLVWRFLPKQERFVAYPMPLKGTYTREFTFPRQGWACTTNNSVPGFIEGGKTELICIDPGRS